VLTRAVPLAIFERLVRLCLESKRGEYYVKLADEKMTHQHYIKHINTLCSHRVSN